MVLIDPPPFFYFRALLQRWKRDHILPPSSDLVRIDVFILDLNRECLPTKRVEATEVLNKKVEGG